MSELGHSSIETNLAQLFMRAFYWADEGLQNALKKQGWPSITRAQSLVFVNISEGVTRPSEIASRVGVTRQAIHQTINEMVELGYLTLQPDPTDRRAKVVVYTEKGKEVGGATVSALQEIESSLSNRIGTERVVALREALAQEWGDPFQPV
ncbi:MarR family winged helix-turn-helix transcriptional regulator [Ketobacter sp.]|uniref:MarR family winged helix-turn-helix transcriptional regulator n=1 Tax=Ketobacter sp. TaxID=2083498 RepID=UPI000F127D63|nr:MarR family winged helix-turn-helix transcriptional regulator [Ketobacter sp.]RLT93255.1 MAG: MarR family transcriptional regulator [Ketobacter sp.]